MGLLFVLIFWVVVLGLLGLPFLVICGLWSWKNSKRSGRPSKSKALMASLLPFAWIATGLVWFVLQGIFNEVVRGVDLGIGDGWQVPIRNNYYFCMIDRVDEGYLMKDGCSGKAPVSEINKLDEIDNFVVGTRTNSSAFALNTQSGAVMDFKSMTELASQFPSLPPLKSSFQFYFHRRWGWQDVVGLAVLVGLLISVTCSWFLLFIRAKVADETSQSK